MSKGVRVKWECPACGARHKWAWESGHEGAIWMDCDHCDAQNCGTLYRDGNTKKGRPLYRWRAG